jgi:hypothetical protein
MRTTDAQLDAMIASQEALVPDAAGEVDVQRGHVARSGGQLLANRREAIRILDSRRELASVKLRAGL